MITRADLIRAATDIRTPSRQRLVPTSQTTGLVRARFIPSRPLIVSQDTSAPTPEALPWE